MVRSLDINLDLSSSESPFMKVYIISVSDWASAGMRCFSRSKALM